ncbi:hypothetical protein ACWDV4_17010 [Micromonospora sp. NPDC003197]
MAQGEAESGSADPIGEQTRPVSIDAESYPTRPEPVAEEDRIDRVPWQRRGEHDRDGAVVPAETTGTDGSATMGTPLPIDPPSTCRTDRPGWAGAHRHGAVRPRQRTHRRERPPRRWC